MGEIGIIGGSGVYQMEGVNVVKEHTVDTPYGMPSDSIVEAELNGAKFFFVARHARGHKILPHEINYCANIYALKKLGVKYLISISAVGSLKEENAPTHFVLPEQFIDWTKGGRRRSFFGGGIVGHVSTAVPVDLQLQNILSKSCEKNAMTFQKGGTYICIEGPQFSSKAESNLYRSFGADVIGMTNVPESYLAKEAGMAYATIAMVTDYDCWKEEHCEVEEIMKVMVENNKNVQGVLSDALLDLNSNKFDFTPENTNAIMTSKDLMTSKQREIVEVLLS